MLFAGKTDALKTLITHTDEERNTLWDIRKSISPSLSKVDSVKFNEDLSVPRSKVRDVLKKVYELSKVHIHYRWPRSDRLERVISTST